jgi:hypothetical protein
VIDRPILRQALALMPQTASGSVTVFIYRKARAQAVLAAG